METDGEVRVTFAEPAFGGDSLDGPLDLLVARHPRCPTKGPPRLSKLLKVPLQAGRFLPGGARQAAPRRFRQRGIFLAGAAHYPKSLDESIGQAYAAAGRAAAILAKQALKAGGIVAEVDQEKCAACLTCVRVCPYEVPRIDPEAKKAHIEAAACQGCGVCVSECPAKAIELHHYTDAQIFAKEEASFTEADLAAGVALSVGGPADAPDACDIPPEVS